MIAAIVVSYFPNYAVLDALLLGLLEQTDLVIYVNNGGGENYLNHLPAQKAKIQLMDFGKNKGIGFALNQGFELAVHRGCKYVATFDQDSVLPEGLIRGLMEAHLELQGKGVACAAVGPAFYDHREGQVVYYPFYREEGGAIRVIPVGQAESHLVEVDVLITSGMLIKAEVWEAGIHYDPGLFVDHTDTDWCHRARSKGFKLFACFQLKMGHALSDTPPVRIMGRNYFRYSPLRRYYYFRNTMFLVFQPYVASAWKRRLAYGLGLRLFVNFAIDRSRLGSLKMMSKGIMDAVSGKMGEFDRASR